MSKHKTVLVAHLKHLPGPLTGAEIGVYRANTSEHLMVMLPQLTMLYLVDRWAAAAYTAQDDPLAKRDDWEEVYWEASRRMKPYADRSQIIRADSAAAATQVPDASLDFAFIDADHSYATTLADCRAWWPKIKPGGLMFGHDYGWHVKWLKNCTRAYKQFGAEVGVSPQPEKHWLAVFPK